MIIVMIQLTMQVLSIYYFNSGIVFSIDNFCLTSSLSAKYTTKKGSKIYLFKIIK